MKGFVLFIISATVFISFSFQKTFAAEKTEVHFQNLVFDYNQNIAAALPDAFDMQNLLQDLHADLQSIDFYSKEFQELKLRHQALVKLLGVDRVAPFEMAITEPVRISITSFQSVRHLNYFLDIDQKVRRRDGIIVHAKVTIGQELTSDVQFVISDGVSILSQLRGFFKGYFAALAVRHNPKALAQLDADFTNFIYLRIKTLSLSRLSSFFSKKDLKYEARISLIHSLENMLSRLERARAQGNIGKQLASDIAAYNMLSSRKIFDLLNYNTGSKNCVALLK